MFNLKHEKGLRQTQAQDSATEQGVAGYAVGWEEGERDVGVAGGRLELRERLQGDPVPARDEAGSENGRQCGQAPEPL